jgi:HlyD family secretion protein
VKSSYWLIVLACVFAACNGNGGASEEGKASSPSHAASVRVRGVTRQTFEDAVHARGEWRAAEQVVVTAPAAGILDSMAARPGDQVAAGQVLTRLTPHESLASLRGAALLRKEAATPAARAEAERAMELARRELVRVPVIAARGGVITSISAPAGSELEAGAEILTIVPAGGIVFEARIGPADADRIQVGQSAEIWEGNDLARSARVSRLLPLAGEGDQSSLFWLVPVGPGVAPQIGRFGEAHIVVGSSRSAPAVPDSAVIEDDLTGTFSVDVVGADRRAIRTPVVLGAGSSGGWRELLSPPLPPGTLVVIEGQRGLPDSIQVQWQP